MDKKKKVAKYVKSMLSLSIMLMLVILSVACSQKEAETTTAVTETTTAVLEKIDAEAAKKIMDSESDIIILDVRTQEEYDSGHIQGALLLPYDQIEQKAAEALPDKDKKILVYCRSGNRSNTASNTLSKLGYTQIYDFGGIIDWPYDVVK